MLVVIPLSFHSAGGDQGAAQTFAPRATAFFAVASSAVVPFGFFTVAVSVPALPLKASDRLAVGLLAPAAW